MTTLSLIPTTDLLQELQRRGATAGPSAKPSTLPQGELPPLVVTVLEVVERVFRIPQDEVLGHCREEHLVKARFAAWMLLADQGMTRRETASAFQRQDVGTIRHGCLRGRELVRGDKSFARAMWEAYHALRRLTGKSARQRRGKTGDDRP